MNREEIYKKSVDVLFAAYFKDELKHGDCEACAVGNICAEASDSTRISRWRWNNIFYTNQENRIQIFAEQGFVISYGDEAVEKLNSWNRSRREDADKLIASTGYSIRELAQIENAFETAKRGRSKEDYMFNGLVAVLDVLKQIHEVADNGGDVTRFRNHYTSKTQTV